MIYNIIIESGDLRHEDSDELEELKLGKMTLHFGDIAITYNVLMCIYRSQTPPSYQEKRTSQGTYVDDCRSPC